MPLILYPFSLKMVFNHYLFCPIFPFLWPHSRSISTLMPFVSLLSSIFCIILTFLLLKMVCNSYESSILPFFPIAITSFSLRSDPNEFNTSSCSVFCLTVVSFFLKKACNEYRSLFLPFLSIVLTSFSLKLDSKAFSTSILNFTCYNAQMVFTLMPMDGPTHHL